MPVRARKFATIEEMNFVLSGGLIGAQVDKGIRGLVGKTVTFTSPSAVTVTFTTHGDSARDPDLLLFKDIRTQLEAAVAGLSVRGTQANSGTKLVLVETSPSAGVALSGATEEGKLLLGFDANTATVGQVVNPDGPTTPYIVQAYMCMDNSHVLLIAE